MSLELQALWVSEYGVGSGPAGHGPPTVVERLTLVADSIIWPIDPQLDILPASSDAFP